LSIATALAQLSEQDQELIALRFGADLTAAQMAQILGSKTNTVEVALHRALARLRSILESESESEREQSEAHPRKPSARTGSPEHA
jgi:DNA-directed RNA polymerase specialized sigma24 family protein